MSRMSMTEQLDGIRSAVPGCTEVAFADLSAGLVLCVSADRRPPQEAMDALCALAGDLLDSADSDRAAGLIATPSGRLTEAVAMVPGQTLAFLRSAADPVEALCCVADASVDLDRLLTWGRQTLEEIGGTA